MLLVCELATVVLDMLSSARVFVRREQTAGCHGVVREHVHVLDVVVVLCELLQSTPSAAVAGIQLDR